MRSCSVGTSLMNFSPSLMLADGSKGCCKLLQCSSYPCGSAACFSHANVLFMSFLKWTNSVVLYIRDVQLNFAILVANFVLFFYSFICFFFFVLFSE
jgi:hypothetical protein